MMENLEALEVISRHRGENIVIATMTCNREWSPISTNPDFDLPVGGSMGKASSMGLGLALARPDKKVLVLDGDGALLMNLGSLVTIANMAPPNLIHFVFENTVYRTTGGQPIPNVGRFSFAALARDAGYANVHEFDNTEDLERNIDNIINAQGPTFVRLDITPATERPPTPHTRTIDVLPRFRAALQRSARS